MKSILLGCSIEFLLPNNKDGISEKKWLFKIIFINFLLEGVRCDDSNRLLRNTSHDNPM